MTGKFRLRERGPAKRKPKSSLRPDLGPDLVAILHRARVSGARKRAVSKRGVRVYRRLPQDQAARLAITKVKAIRQRCRELLFQVLLSVGWAPGYRKEVESLIGPIQEEHWNHHVRVLTCPDCYTRWWRETNALVRAHGYEPRVDEETSGDGY